MDIYSSRKHYGLSDDSIYVSDWDWNEHYVAVEFHGTIGAHFVVRIAENEDEHEEVEEVKEEYSVQSIEVLAAVLE